MGFWSGLCNLVSKVKNGVKKGVKKIKEKVTNTWNKFTGKEKFEKAEKLYQEISEQYNLRRRQFEEDVEMYTGMIEQYVKEINQSKEKIRMKLFPEMAKKIQKLQDVSISTDFTVEQYVDSKLAFDEIRSKDDLYKIDFNKNKFKTTAQAIFTLGFYTRKKANETLMAVQEEEGKVKTEIAKMDAEIVRIKLIEQSLANVRDYYTSLTSQYQNMLVRLDNSVNFLYVRCLAFAHKIVAKEMSVKRLPLAQRKEIEAVITISKILKEMTEKRVVSVENKKELDKYCMESGKCFAEIQKNYNAA